jgi:hypothetical protein
MTVWSCLTCGIEYPDAVTSPDCCLICTDERQYVPPTGQQWVTQQQLESRHAFTLTEVEPRLHSIEVTPAFGIGHRPLVVSTDGGNLVWEPSGFLSPGLVDAIRNLGPVVAISASHPHLTGASISLSHALGGVPVYVNADDRRWVCRPDDVIEFWTDRLDITAGLSLVQAGGHFPGSSVAHWAGGAGGRGVLLSGDTVMVSADLRSVSFMRSYPNNIPLSARSVRKIAAALAPLDYDRIRGAFGTAIQADSRQLVEDSANRYIGWLTDAIRDPDERL